MPPVDGGDCPCAGGAAFDLGALRIEGLDGGRSERPVRAAPIGAVLEAPRLESFGGEMDLDDEASGPSLEVDEAHERRPAALVRVRPPEEDEFDPLEAARTLAQHGECRGWIGAPLYAIRVKQRQTELRRELKRLEESRAATERQAEETLARVGEAVRARAATDATLGALVRAVEQAETRSRERELALQAADSSWAAQSEAMRGRIAEIGERVAPIRTELERLEATLRARQDGHRRVLAQARRAEIEIRNLRDLANARDTEASASTEAERKTVLATQAAELRARAPEHESVLAGHRAQAAEMEGPIGELERQRSELRRRMQDAEGDVARLEAEQRKDSADLDRSRRERHRVVEGARAAVRERLAELGRNALERRFAADAIEPMLPAVQEAAERAEAVRRDEALHVAALDVHDRARVRQGLVMLAGALASVVTGLVALLAW